MSEFDFGMYGSNSKVHPTNLPFNHPDFCTWADEEKRLVRHSRTGEKCRLVLDDSFYATGVYTLITTDGNSKTRTAPSWNSRALVDAASVLKGKELSIVVRVNAILYKNTLVNSITLNKLSTPKVLLVVSSIKWESFALINPALIKDYYQHESKKVKGGTRRAPKSQRNN